MQRAILTYILTALIVFTATIYFVVAVEESGEEGYSQDSQQGATSNGYFKNMAPTISTANQEEHKEDGGAFATRVQVVFFAAVGLAYSGLAVWVFNDKGHSNAPCVIAIVGSIAMIGLYVASRTINLPIVGLQGDIGTIDILAKVLQVGIIGVAAFMFEANSVARSLYNR